MNKLLQILLLSLVLVGCSSLELETAASSESETQRILAMGLTHEENLIEASKLKSSHMVSVVTGQLNKVRDEKIQAEFDLVESAKFADMVIVSGNNSSFIGPEISESIMTGILIDDVDLQDYFLQGLKDTNSGIVSHQLQLKLTHNSSDKRNYFSANLCDKWMRCDGNETNISQISTSVSNCISSSCDYREVIEVNLTDEFLRSNMETGFSMRFNSKKETNKITISSAYLKGYLQVAN